MFEIVPYKPFADCRRPSAPKRPTRACLRSSRPNIWPGPGDETYSRNGAKSAAGSEDEFEESSNEDEVVAEPLSLPATPDGEDPKINLFI